MKKQDTLSDMASEPVRQKIVTIPWTKIFLGIAFVATITGALVSTKSIADINKNVAAAKEDARAANVKIVKITDAACTDCVTIDNAVAEFKKLNVKVEEEKTLAFDSPEASASIKLLAIKKIPTYIVTGEIGKKNIETFLKNNGEITNKSFIFTKTSPVYISTETRKEVGLVTATILTDPSCSQCPNPILDSLKKTGVHISSEKEIAWNSFAGQQLISSYKITKVPTILLSPDIDYYESIKSAWKNIGTIESDTTYIARNSNPPYRDIPSNRIVGLVDVVYLTDAGCADCYKVADVQKPILTNGYGVAIRSERFVDISSSEGQGLVSTYGITKIPTLLLSPDANDYPALKAVWNSVGKIASDGWYIFTEFTQLRGVTYKDVTNNTIVRPAGQPSPVPTK